MIGTLRSFVLGIIIGWPSRALWLLRHKVDPLEALQGEAERKYLRRRETARDLRLDRPRITACGASGIAYRF
jgi:hypothetical protein